MPLVFFLVLVTSAKTFPAPETLKNETELSCWSVLDMVTRAVSEAWGWVLCPKAPPNPREGFPWLRDGVSSVRPPTEANRGAAVVRELGCWRGNDRSMNTSEPGFHNQRPPSLMLRMVLCRSSASPPAARSGGFAFVLRPSSRH